MAELTLVQAVNAALARAMEEDERVLVLGEDVGVDGGVFRATDGLLDRFGPTRVFDTPLAETVIAGASVGLVAQGFRPVAEIQFMGFMYSTLDQMISHAARLRWRTRGRLTCPMVLRAPYGGGIGALEHHSESTEALFAQVPGLRVVIPSSPNRAYGLLLNAIRCPDPVVFLEPKRIYRTIKEDVALETAAAPLDSCFILNEGRDLTLVSWGASVVETMVAAEALSRVGVGAEVIDVGTLRPLDGEAILRSVEKTGRCVIVHEAPRTGGFGGEIAARLSEDGLLFLQAPVKRVTGYDTVMPLRRLEQHYLPSTGRILAAAREVLAFA